MDRDGRQVFSGSEERTCPRCGLTMDQLLFQLWQCKCGYKKKAQTDVEEVGEEEHESRRRRGEGKGERFKGRKQPPRKGLRRT